MYSSDTDRRDYKPQVYKIVTGWQWANEQMILAAIRITDPDPDPDRDNGKTCLGGCMHSSSGSSYYY